MALTVTACATDQSTASRTMLTSDRQAGAEGYQPVTLHSKDSSVELFSLDNGQALAQSGTRSFGTSSVLPGSGRPAVNDPSVTVFPFADDGYGAPIQRQQINALTPLTSVPPAYMPMEDPALYPGNRNVIYFNHGSAALDQPARQIIARVARGDYGGHLEVAAHASQRAQTSDPVERGILNFRMSMKRALAVTKQLIHDGVPPEAIKATAYGDARLAVPESDRAAEAKNRRVHILTGVQ